MTAAALTPRVRILAVCDGIRESKTEAGVFDLKGVRQAIHAESFPFVPSRLWLYLLLSSPRGGEYPAYVLITDNNDKTIFYGTLMPNPTFMEGKEMEVGRARIRCSFPEAGRYSIQVWFFQPQGCDVLKGELPFDVLQEGG